MRVLERPWHRHRRAQAEAERVPLADGTLMKAPVDEHSDDALLAAVPTLPDVYSAGCMPQ